MTQISQMWMSLSGGDGCTPANWVPESVRNAWREMLANRDMESANEAERACRAAIQACYVGSGTMEDPDRCIDKESAMIAWHALRAASAAFSSLRAIENARSGYCQDDGYSDKYADLAIRTAQASI